LAIPCGFSTFYLSGIIFRRKLSLATLDATPDFDNPTVSHFDGKLTFPIRDTWP
jgi:hypothetical protein